MPNVLFVVDEDMEPNSLGLNAIDFARYLRDYPILGAPKPTVINLCDTSKYLSQGYYCSLLAEARRHRVIPSARVINTLRQTGTALAIDKDLLPECADAHLFGTRRFSCMGHAADQRFTRVAEFLFRQNPAPLFYFTCERQGTGINAVVTICSMADLDSHDLDFCKRKLAEYADKSWSASSKRKHYRWELAMLVDPDEASPPSNPAALRLFESAGKKLGIRVHTVSAGDITYLEYYDALFIRETTAINHHTYRLARDAEDRGLIVIDDPSSILRCCNKIFLHDAFNYRKVPSLRTICVNNSDAATLDMLETELGYPIILKTPEGSFSRGVVKADNRAALDTVINHHLTESALVLAQEYCYTDYDWRIGVLNGRPLYACRYYMARGHWQIYNHSCSGQFSGGFDTVPIYEAPANILSAALKSAKIIGDGLYGIDLKVLGKKAYVLEVNDNPSIDHGIEDAVLGKGLYMEIMSEFLRRLELRGRQVANSA